MRKRWEYVGFVTDLSLKLTLGAMLLDGSQALCPLCNEGFLRFYFHMWPTVEGVNIPPRGAIWVWCPECGKWASQGNLGLKKVDLPDPFSKLSREEFRAIKKEDEWIDQLNKLWEKGDLHTIR